MAYKEESIYYLAFHRKSLLTPEEKNKGLSFNMKLSQPLPTFPISSSFQLLQTPMALSQALLLKTPGSCMGTFSPHIRDIFLSLTWYKSIHHFKFNSKVMFSLHLS